MAQHLMVQHLMFPVPVRVCTKPPQVVGMHGELLQLSDTTQISFPQILQSRTSKLQSPQPE